MGTTGAEAGCLDRIQRARSGDRKALDELLREAARRARRSAARRGVDDSTADDIAQEVSIAVSRNLITLKEAGAWPSWVHRIIDCRIRDYRRRDARHHRVLAPANDGDSLVDRVGLDTDLGVVVDLRSALSTLRDGDRALLLDYGPGGAAIPAVVRKRIQRVRERVRAYLAEDQ
ncbi:MAG: hypothetical protein IT379_42130 [Deltaproteobacteria bacterium]|nr:hypothetical protein [Deltaproteobacteria bacterium]